MQREAPASSGVFLYLRSGLRRAMDVPPSATTYRISTRRLKVPKRAPATNAFEANGPSGAVLLRVIDIDGGNLTAGLLAGSRGLRSDRP